jgi:hypothetical protein
MQCQTQSQGQFSRSKTSNLNKQATEGTFFMRLYAMIKSLSFGYCFMPTDTEAY